MHQPPAYYSNLLAGILCASSSFWQSVLTIIALVAFVVNAPGEQSLEINSFSGSSFFISSPSEMEGGTFTEQRNSPLGTYQFTVAANGCSVSRSNGTATLIPLSNISNGTGGYVGFIHAFDQPINLSAFDYFGIEMSHDKAFNPLDSFFLYLSNGKSIQMRPISGNQYHAQQTKFPVYALQSRHDVFRHHPTRVSMLYVQMQVLNGSSISLDSIRVARIAPRPALALDISKGGSRDLVLKFARPSPSTEMYRLEASHDLNRWFDKGQITRGTGTTPIFEKHFYDARFYRVSFYNYVETETPP